MDIKTCSVKRCGNPSVKTVAVEKLKEVSLDVESKGRKVYLCKKHYKEYKRARRKIERLERWRWQV